MADMVRAAGRESSTGGRRMRVLGAGVRHLVLLLVAAICIVPFLWMLGTSFKEQNAVFSATPSLLPEHFVTSAYYRVTHLVPEIRWAINSVAVAVLTTTGQLVFATMAAYAFARIRFRGRNALFVVYLGTMMVPSQVTIVPLYIVMKYLGWVDTYYALIVPFAFTSAFGTFLLRQYFLTVPRELEDAARIDGAGPVRILWSVVLPTARPVMATFGVFSFMFFWNDLLWPLIVTNSESRMTLPVGLANFAIGQYHTDWPAMMAGTVISLIPILAVFVFIQRYFVQGITLTGVRG